MADGAILGVITAIGFVFIVIGLLKLWDRYIIKTDVAQRH